MRLTKRCCKCGEELPVESFGSHKGTKDGLQKACVPCSRAYNREYRAANIEKIKRDNLEYRVKQQYECTAAEYEERMASSSSCEICGTTENLVYDHCHDTMAFRGVLCRKHNAAIGQLGDTVEGLQAALNYLTKGK